MPSSNSTKFHAQHQRHIQRACNRSGLTPLRIALTIILVDIEWRQAVDPRVIGETFVVIGDDALGDCFAELFQRKKAQNARPATETCLTCPFDDEPQAAQPSPLRVWIYNRLIPPHVVGAFLFFGWAILPPTEALLSSFQNPVSFHSRFIFLPLLFCHFLSEDFWPWSPAIPPAAVSRKWSFDMSLLNAVTTKKQPFFTDARLADQHFRFFAFAPIHADQIFCAGPVFFSRTASTRTAFAFP